MVHVHAGPRTENELARHKTKGTAGMDSNSRVLTNYKIAKTNIKMERQVEDIMLKMLEEWRELCYCSSECLIIKLSKIYHLIETLFIVRKYSILISLLVLLLPLHHLCMEVLDHLYNFICTIIFGVG